MDEATMIIGGLGLGAAAMLLFTLAKPPRAKRMTKSRPHPTPFAMPANGNPAHVMASRQAGARKTRRPSFAGDL